MSDAADVPAKPADRAEALYFNSSRAITNRWIWFVPS